MIQMNNYKVRMFVYVITTLLLFCGCNDRRELPRQVAADYNSDNTPYLVFDIRADGEAETVAVQNIDVFHRFREEFGLDSLDYVETVQNHIENEKPFEVSRAAMIRLQPYYVQRHERVDSLLALGTEGLTEYYFNARGFLKRELSKTEVSYLIKALFDKSVYVTISGFSGELALYPPTNPSNYDLPSIPDTSVVPVVPQPRQNQ